MIQPEEIYLVSILILTVIIHIHKDIRNSKKKDYDKSFNDYSLFEIIMSFFIIAIIFSIINKAGKEFPVISFILITIHLVISGLSLYYIIRDIKRLDIKRVQEEIKVS
jgi:hypothetical protein